MLRNLSIVIPVYNESARLSKTFDALTGPVDWGIFQLQEIIFVNDGSKDNTLELIKKAKLQLEKRAKASVKVISYQKNRGKGYAVKKGMLASKADYTLMMDADISTPLSEIARFQASAKKNIPVIIGTRKSKVVRVEKEQPWLRRNMGKVFTLLSQLILNTWVTDFTCGFKLFSFEACQQIFKRSQIERWGYDSEILFLAHKLGFQIKEIAVRWRNDERSKVNLIKDAWKSLTELFQIRFNQISGNYSLSQYRYKPGLA